MTPEHHALARELTTMVRESLGTTSDVTQSVSRWVELGAREKSLRFCQVNEAVAAEVRKGAIRSAVINHPELVHLFWLLDLSDEVVVRYIGLLRDAKIRSHFPLTKFWQNYVEAFAVFSGLPGAALPFPKPRATRSIGCPISISWQVAPRGTFLSAKPAHHSWRETARIARSIGSDGMDSKITPPAGI